MAEFTVQIVAKAQVEREKGEPLEDCQVAAMEAFWKTNANHD